MRDVKKLMAVFLLGVFFIGPAFSKPLPLDYFALRANVRNVIISPDGKHLALLRINSKKGNPIVEVYDTDDMSKKPFRVNADPMEFARLYWVTNETIFFVATQKVRDKIDGWNQGIYDGRVGKINIKTKVVKRISGKTSGVESTLPSKPNKILTFHFKGWNIGGTEQLIVGRPTPTYYEVDLKKGTRRLVMQATLTHNQIQFDGSGRAYAASGLDEHNDEYVVYARLDNSRKWEEIYRQHQDSFEKFSVIGFDDEKPHMFFVIANNGRDTAGFWEFDAKQKKFKELIYQREDVDVLGALRHSNRFKYADRFSAIYYKGGIDKRVYLDGEEQAIYRQLKGLIPAANEADDLYIVSRSREGGSMVVYHSNPRDPGSYYLLHKGKFSKIGGRSPLIKSKDLAEVKYIKYKSRDGKTIPAYITIPHGEPPFPLVVMPHGGPYVDETVRYDEWGQMLANNGYLVLQPQYRGSQGYGQEFYKSAFINGGQGGYKMQDDKDDGALYLVKKGLADRDKLAMYGWSYGGYAALVAAARTPQIYQCAIAGAAVTDNNLQINYYRHANWMRGSVRIEQITTWDESISPIKEVAKVNVPLLVIHGDVDQRVPYEHAKRYFKALKQHNVPYKELTLKGSDHFSSSMYFDHKKKLYQSIIDFLKDDCNLAAR